MEVNGRVGFDYAKFTRPGEVVEQAQPRETWPEVLEHSISHIRQNAEPKAGLLDPWNPGQHGRIEIHPHDGVLLRQLLDLLRREADAVVAGDRLPVSLGIQNVCIVIQTVRPVGLFKTFLLYAGNSQQVAMRLLIGRSAEDFSIVEDHGLQIHA